MQMKHIGMLPSSGYQDAHSTDVNTLDPFDVFAESSRTPLVETKRQRFFFLNVWGLFLIVIVTQSI